MKRCIAAFLLITIGCSRHPVPEPIRFHVDNHGWTTIRGVQLESSWAPRVVSNQIARDGSAEVQIEITDDSPWDHITNLITILRIAGQTNISLIFHDGMVSTQLIETYISDEKIMTIFEQGVAPYRR